MHKKTHASQKSLPTKQSLPFRGRKLHTWGERHDLNKFCRKIGEKLAISRLKKALCALKRSFFKRIAIFSPKSDQNR
jgi:hypothetical protein